NPNVSRLAARSSAQMTFFDLQPIDPYEARFKFIATLVLLSELGLIGDEEPPSTKARASDPSRSRPSKRAARSGPRLVRPPRSC
ncbi:MAG TPA: hypothetical protein VLX59_03820, partial [Acidimicrobiales bacterium]|nr:hypothetical protein [Acidimicrobiales bacterium]